MKNLFSFQALVCSVIVLLIFSSCKKQPVEHLNAIENKSTLISGKEVANDDWSKISKIPLFVSANYFNNNNSYSLAVANLKTRSGSTGTTDVTPPVVSISNPLNGSTISGNVSINVSATDNVAVSSVSVGVDGVMLGTLTIPPYNFVWNCDNAIIGTHAISATAKDAKNNTATVTITVTKNSTINTSPTITLPAAFSLTTPPIQKQGNEGSCVAFATAYAARSIESFYRTGSTTYNNAVNLFSPEYVYNQTKLFADCNSGTAFTLALDLMKNKGVCTWNSMPYSDMNGCSILPNANQDAEASMYKIPSYSKIINNDRNMIKTMLYNRHPVMINVTMDNGFINATPGFIWNSYSGSGSLPHALIICGYDDAKNAYKVMNSVGTAWGDAGYSWIDYNYFTQVSSYYLYVMNY